VRGGLKPSNRSDVTGNGDTTKGISEMNPSYLVMRIVKAKGRDGRNSRGEVEERAAKSRDVDVLSRARSPILKIATLG